MALTEDTATFLADFGEAVTVQGVATTAIVNMAGELALGEHVTTGITLDLPASIAAVEGGAITMRGNSYRIRQVLPMPPDGAWQQLVLART